MKVIVSYTGTSRQIDSSFSICASKEDLLSIKEQIENRIRENFSYGWVDIYADLPERKPNNPPIPWNAPG